MFWGGASICNPSCAFCALCSIEGHTYGRGFWHPNSCEETGRQTISHRTIATPSWCIPATDRIRRKKMQFLEEGKKKCDLAWPQTVLGVSMISPYVADACQIGKRSRLSMLAKKVIERWMIIIAGLQHFLKGLTLPALIWLSWLATLDCPSALIRLQRRPTS